MSRLFDSGALPRRNVGAIGASEFLLIQAGLSVALVYLEVPARNAVQISLALMFQAAIGTVVLVRFVKIGNAPILFFLGPSLVVGGAVAFLLFQTAGRGNIGLVLVTTIGTAATYVLCRPITWQLPRFSCLWTLFQLVSLAALALSWEFGEFLPLAVVGFIFGLVVDSKSQLPKFWILPLCLMVVVVAVIAYISRRDFWWLVTDDYQRFEIMSRHLLAEGVFSDWGGDDTTRYHWLSYGWSGLLNALGGTPDSFVTLTRVMPFAYSLSLASSLALIVSCFLQESILRSFSLLPVWFVLAANRLDWSGTSTSGVFATIAAAIAVAILEVCSTTTPSRRLILYCIGIPIALLTKFPSVFALVSVICLLELWLLAKARSQIIRNVLLCLGAVTLLSVVGIGIGFGGTVLGRWDVSFLSPNLGDIASFGVPFAVLTLVSKNWWIAVVVGIGLLGLVRTRGTHFDSASKFFVLIAIPLTLTGLFLDLSIVGIANTAEYFSGPMYFFGSLVALGASSHAPQRIIGYDVKKAGLTISGLLIASGYLWDRFEIAARLSGFLGSSAFRWSDQEISVFQWATSDIRFFVAFIATPLTLFGLWKTRFRQAILVSVLFTSVVLTMVQYSESSQKDFQRLRTTEEIALFYGSPDIRAVGRWIKENSTPTEKIATNSLEGILDGVFQGSNSDYALAVWSEREFLVLGPQLGGVTDDTAIRVSYSLAFADSPSSRSCQNLLDQGVGWFVVDLKLTNVRNWHVCADVAFQAGDFWVLRLRD